MNGYQKHLKDEQYNAIVQFFPLPRKPREIPLRRCVEAILYVLTEGCSWRKIPYEYRNKEEDWNTIYMSYKRWCLGRCGGWGIKVWWGFWRDKLTE